MILVWPPARSAEKGLRLRKPTVWQTRVGSADVRTGRGEDIRLAIKLTGDGMSLREIGDALTAAGCPPKRGQAWHRPRCRGCFVGRGTTRETRWEDFTQH